MARGNKPCGAGMNDQALFPTMANGLLQLATLLPARWPGGPEICPAVNLPAFKDVKSCTDFVARSPVIEIWKCKACGHWHAWTRAHAPAGESSGGAREYTMPAGIREMIDRTKEGA